MTMTEQRLEVGSPPWLPSDSYAEAVVDLDAIRHNTALLSDAARGGLMAVVKANAFGHGAVPVARTALASGASWLGVTSVAEALELRNAGISAPVLAWMHLPDDDLWPVIDQDVDLAVSSLEHLEAIASTARRHGAPVAIHLKVDSGLHRGGADPADWAALVRRGNTLEARRLVRVRGVWSHLARADEPMSQTTRQQVRVFDQALAQARAAGLDPDVVHLANSAALLGDPTTHYDLARAGIALYGVEPIPGRSYGLRPAMTLQARTLMRRTVEAGAGVSYGHQYVTDRTTTLALVPLGYADGIPRAAGGRAEVLVDGARRAVAGRIAMDQFVVDAGDSPVEIGDPVVVFGPGTSGEPTVKDWADWAATNPHEILTGIGSRVARHYLPASDGPAGRTRVAVVFGGASAEHEVSCASGAALISALDPTRYDAVPVLIDPRGVWRVGSASAPVSQDRWSSVVEAMRVLRGVDVVIPALHGPQGEDGTLQGLLATLDVPFVGSGVLASAVGMDKAVAKDVFRAAGLAVADGVVLAAGESVVTGEVRERLGLPVFVKPARAGSSQGVTRVDAWADLPTAVEVAREYDPKVIVEAAAMGREVDIAVLEHPDGRIEAGPPLEITYAADQSHFSYAAKYADEETVFEIPARLDDATTRLLQARAVEVFDLLGCRGLLRVDFLLGDGTRPPVLNEVNTFPGFTSASQFPRIWAAAGLDYPALVDTLVRTAMGVRQDSEPVAPRARRQAS
jgi:alanine racemase